MIVTGKIVDKQTQTAIPFATVQLVSSEGKYLGVGSAANDKGNFSIASSMIAPPNALVFSAAGSNYLPLAVNIDVLNNTQAVLIGLETKVMDEVVITFKPKPSLWWLLLLPLLFIDKKYFKNGR